jgi:hypothetical protein
VLNGHPATARRSSGTSDDAIDRGLSAVCRRFTLDGFTDDDLLAEDRRLARPIHARARDHFRG